MNITRHDGTTRRRGSVLRTATAALIAGTLAGCSEQPAPQVPVAPATRPAPIAARKAPAPKPETTGSIHVDEEIARVCDIPTAHFAFDSSNINGTAAEALDKVASCLSEGPLKGQSLKIVGYADPRGTIEYNFALGQRRAGSVAEFLRTHGLANDKMTTSSMGELEATGKDEAGWARDRKVEIMLAHKALVEPSRETHVSMLDR